MNRISEFLTSAPRHVVRHAIACREAGRVADHAASQLRFSRIEWRRFQRKTLNLTLCYLGFSCDDSLDQIRRAAVAGVACAIYDVLTDWRGFDQENRESLPLILGEFVDPHLVESAVDLYDREWQGTIGNDGLERGSCSLLLILRVLGSLEYWQASFDLQSLGIVLQVVDDVLDYEADVARNETNCLTTPRWRYHLNFMKSQLDRPEAWKLYVRGPILRMAVAWALAKAERFMAKGRPVSCNEAMIKQAGDWVDWPSAR